MAAPTPLPKKKNKKKTFGIPLHLDIVVQRPDQIPQSVVWGGTFVYSNPIPIPVPLGGTVHSGGFNKGNDTPPFTILPGKPTKHEFVRTTGQNNNVYQYTFQGTTQGTFSGQTRSTQQPPHKTDLKGLGGHEDPSGKPVINNLNLSKASVNRVQNPTTIWDDFVNGLTNIFNGK